MRFIHIADVHLGARPDAGPLYSEGRARELWETFEHVLGVCEEERDGPSADRGGICSTGSRWCVN